MSDYRELPPPPCLAPYLVCSWTEATGEGRADLPKRILPDGCIDIVCIGEAAPAIAGPATHAVVANLPPRTTIVGVRFRTGAAPSLLGIPANELLNQDIPLEDVWGNDSVRLAGQLESLAGAAARLAVLEAALVVRLPHAHPVDEVVAAAVGRFRRRSSVRVDELGDSLGLSERQLLRRFEFAVGYGPKTLARVLRFRRALRLADRPCDPGMRLADIAAQAGYSDQAHMSREVNRLAGLTPTSLLTPGPPA